MKQFILYLLLFTLLSTGIARSQVPAKDTPQVLEELFDRLIDNYNDSARIRINDSIRLVLDGRPRRVVDHGEPLLRRRRCGTGHRAAVPRDGLPHSRRGSAAARPTGTSGRQASLTGLATRTVSRATPPVCGARSDAGRSANSHRPASCVATASGAARR